ncbi:ABC transporter ATP-binding protein [Motiliproteus sp. MSK22-1]|uniref:ABC transporter ATP-binding protein n=1 Tax=Motiliproteus sp. MSK22-1 TaxID=1897630 RepID=UPI0009765554|nr:ABC transporter ATP-binding protein [Motiliproteus sp. MSK22-1]OMH30408.1 ABC transporter [Motiliproteus sp. MSK22-1]
MIEVTNLQKRFKLYDKPSDRLKEIAFRRSYHRSFQALKDISFQVAAGETLGILGKNGAGKSTLLKILTGVLLADQGDIHIDGKITGLLELGTGFDQDLTGLQNIIGNGLLIGMTREQVAERQDAIIEFSELGDFIYEPIRTYSSGMVMRLAFSIAIHADPRCFVVDEALSVGDGHFQQKCMRRIKQFRQSGGSIIFVSHDLNAVKMLCDRALVLDQGMMVAEGSPEHAVNQYNRIMSELDDKELKMREHAQEEGFGNGSAKIIDSRIWGEDSDSEVVSAGEYTQLYFDIQASCKLDDVSIGMMIRDRFGQDIFGTNSHLLEQPLSMEAGQVCRASFRLPMDIAPGKYTVTAALHSDENHIENCYYWRDNLLRFEVAGIRGRSFSGVCRLQPDLEFSSLQDVPVNENEGDASGMILDKKASDKGVLNKKSLDKKTADKKNLESEKQRA